MITDKYFLQVENIGYFVSRNIAQATSVNWYCTQLDTDTEHLSTLILYTSENLVFYD